MAKREPFLLDLIHSSYGAIFVTGILSILMPFAVLWESINQRFISDNFIAFEVQSGDTSELFFAYISKDVLGTISTSIFWGLVALIGMFIFWVVVSTYERLVNILTIETQYENKSHSYLGEVAVVVAEHVAVAVIAMGIILAGLKLVLPILISLIGINSLSEEVTLITVVSSIFWWLALWAFLFSLCLVAKVAYRSLKNAAA